MRRTGKRAFEPAMGSEGIFQLLMTYSIFMARSSSPKTGCPRFGRRPERKRVFSQERAAAPGTRLSKKGRPEAPFQTSPALHAVRGLAVRVDIEALAFLFFGHAQAYQEVGDLEGDERHHC